MTEYIEYGRRPGGVYIPRFRNVGGEEGVGFRRGYGYQGSARAPALPPEGFGASMKHGHAAVRAVEVRHGRVWRMPAL